MTGIAIATATFSGCADNEAFQVRRERPQFFVRQQYRDGQARQAGITGPV